MNCYAARSSKPRGAGVDFTERSRAAVACGIALVEAFGAVLHLLHMIDGLAADDPVARPVPALHHPEREFVRP